MKKLVWGLACAIACTGAAAHAADKADGAAAPTRASRHRRPHHPPPRHAEPVGPDADAPQGAPSPGQGTPPSAGPGTGKSIPAPSKPEAPPASALPQAPATDPNITSAEPAAPVPTEAPVLPANPPAPPVEEVESVEAEPAAGGTWFTDADPIFDRVFDQYTADTVRPRTFNAFITHRNREGILRGPFYDLLGFDGGGLKVGLAVRYGIFDGLDVGIYRQNGTVEIFDTWEFDGRYRLLMQSASMPVALSVRAGLTWFSASGNNALAGFGEVLVQRRFLNALLVGVNLTYHSNSSSPTKKSTDPRGTGGIGVLAEWRLLDFLSVGAEVTVGALGYSQKYPAISVGPKFITNRHSFAITISNTQSETTDSIITNTWRSNAKDWLLGFNITREM